MTQSQKGYQELNSRLLHATINGDKYVAGHFFEGLGSGVNANLFLSNPADSGKAIVTNPPVITSGKRVDTRLDFNPTQDTAGTDAEVKNRRSDQNNSSVLSAEFGGSYTLNDPFDDIPVGASNRNTYAPTDEDEAFCLVPGDSVLLQATTASNDTDLRLAINYTQLPEGVL